MSKNDALVAVFGMFLIFMVLLLLTPSCGEGREIIRNKDGTRAGTIVQGYGGRYKVYDRRGNRVGTIERRETVQERIDRKNEERRQREGDD